MKIFAAAVVVTSLLAPTMALASVNISLSGFNPTTVNSRSSFVEPGYSAFSSVDGDITGAVVVSDFASSRTYSVTDSTLESAFSSRGIVISAGSVMPYCSGPQAPGWQIGVDGGGCGGTGKLIPAGSPGCAWFTVGGCILE